MRVLGLDLGSVTCGIAISDALRMIARGVETYRFKEDDYEACCQYIAKFVKENDVSEIVLGLPKHMNGDIGIRGQICLEFKDMLQETTGLPVSMWDERLTTVAANKLLIKADVSRKKRKQVIDQMAAVQILQSYLDRR
ncbi:Holliday junction resolvase RuvX [Erysipelotrichaceae bacterium OH741_COT-311]|nr:Holliday junction resolvase RuvX [Erysipelotrichaceae bacterium OH741_COT-311]